MSWERIDIRTPGREAFVDITRKVAALVVESGVREGTVTLYCPHTTAGLTVNENADPDVRHDLLLALGRLVPMLREFRHTEGNSDAHTKASLVGNHLVLPVEAGSLALGTWQGIYFCEFDGPRSRKVLARVGS